MIKALGVTPEDRSIDSTDPVCEFFAGLYTAEEIEDYIRENYPDDEE